MNRCPLRLSVVMAKRPGNRLALAVTGLVSIIMLAVGVHWLVGAPISILVVVVALLLLVWRLDNNLGTLLPLAIIFLLVFAILAALIGALAFVHQLTAG